MASSKASDRALVALIAQLRQLPDTPHYHVAYSGGLDSTVLLLLMRDAAQAVGRSLSAIHVHHGLDPAADDWQRHCERQCDDLGIHLTTRRVLVAAAGGDSLEAVARDARYAAISAVIAAGEAVVSAHHRDDQAETLLLNLLRGSGLDGLAGMPAARRLGEGWLLRPLLDRSRAELEAVAVELGIRDWVQDPSNADPRFRRNHLRHRIMPALEAVQPGSSARLARSAGLLADSLALQRESLDDVLEACRGSSSACLSASRLAQRDPARQRLILRHWLAVQGIATAPGAMLERLVDELIPARADAEPLVAWAGVQIGRYRDDILRLPGWPEPLPMNGIVPGEPINLPDGSRLSWQKVMGQGIDASRVTTLDSTYRTGGERCRPAGREGSRALKKLLQAADMPPWLRKQLPLLVHDGEIVAVPGICVDARVAVGKSQEGWLPVWVPPEG